MSVLEIVTYPADILKRGAKPVDRIDSELNRFIDDMGETMYARQGVGLASVQVNDDRRVIVYDISEEREKKQFKTIINPELVELRGERVSENEGCLSVPGLRADIKRAEWVRVEGLDREDQPVVIEADGLEAVVLQHEIDHLDGVLILDRISRLKKELYKRKVLKKIRQCPKP